MTDGHSHGGHSHRGHSHGNHSHGHGVGTQEGFVPAPCPAGVETQPLVAGAGRGQVLFLDLPSGIAGDMTIAALLDLGVPLSVVENAVEQLSLPGVRLTVESGYAGAIGCSHFDVEWSKQEGERSFFQIKELIEASSLDTGVKALSLAIFGRLAEAEASVHRTTLDQVHFHEVGAVDAIVDIVGAAAAFRYLGAEVKASPVPLGRGFVDCRHGRLPLPAPAALKCLEGVPTVSSGLEAELVTPTGAAIVATVAQEFGDWFPLTPTRIGWGAGTRGLPDRPNAMRAVLGRPQEIQSETQTHVLLEANVDDLTGEVASYALKQLLNSGAVDAWVVPITMKKGRPAMIVSALAPRAQAPQVVQVLMRETTTIGVRQTLVSRTTLPRTALELETPWGKVRIKESGMGTDAAKIKPELDDCILIAEREGLPLRQVLEAIHQLLATRTQHKRALQE